MKYVENNLEKNDSTNIQFPIASNRNEENYNVLEQQTNQKEENYNVLEQQQKNQNEEYYNILEQQNKEK